MVGDDRIGLSDYSGSRIAKSPRLGVPKVDGIGTYSGIDQQQNSIGFGLLPGRNSHRRDQTVARQRSNGNAAQGRPG